MTSPREIIYNWIPGGTQRILDIGCSWGDQAFSFTKKCEKVYGIDINEKYIAKAKNRYPNINFSVAGAEQISFQDGFFSVIVMSEVLEHVTEETPSLNEIFRLLAPNGILILGTPNKGLFGFMDPANQKFYLKKVMPGIFNIFVNWKTKSEPNYRAILSQGIHRHYSLEDLNGLLNRSIWRGRYRIEKVARHGLLLGPLTNSVRALMRSILGNKLSGLLTNPLAFLALLENYISFGRHSYQIKIMVRKLI